MLILDGCCLFEFDEPLPEGSSKRHALKTRVETIMKETQNTLFARACAPNASASDTGEDMTSLTCSQVCKAVLCACTPHALIRVKWLAHALSSLTGVYRKYLLQHLTKPNLEVHTLFRRVGRAVYLATGGKQSPVRPR